ncbi:hypothetical protein AMS62_18275 [Bacillus sp. FJAT-18019]|uniref:DUF2975 domain-containing protein n=1 Tax=Paenibacillus solani TaxID=1705565 RepID=A0A0M1NJJ8_9BACL|nr:DUF2975 domain-containing protein [Paenibacillus solani]KOP66968.1 hypothetical protein AMS62_18275 [Bacillus sp. FJAT-18019]KOR82220.1 hypothetical protein AM231_17895 [Paenibacillus solani]
MNGIEFKAKPGFKRMHTALKIGYWGGIGLLIAFVCFNIWIGLKPQELFSAEKGIMHWFFSVPLSDTVTKSVMVPFTYFQPINPDKFDAKKAYLVVSLTNTVLVFWAYLYSIGKIRLIIGSILSGISPFSLANAARLRRLGIAVIFYSLLAKLILNILICLLVTRIFSINLGSISLIGIIIGILVLFVSEIFKYGALLQEEHDSTF